MLSIPCFGVAQTSPLRIQSADEIYYLQEYIKIYKPLDENLNTPPFNEKAQLQLMPVDYQLKNNQTYWAKIDLRNELVNADYYPEWILSLSLILTEVDAYLVAANGEIQSEKTGFFVPKAQRSFAPVMKANVCKFNFQQSSSYTLWIKFKSERKGLPVKLDANIRHSTTYFLRHQSERHIMTLFMGFVLMILIYSLFLYLFTKDKTYLHYSWYLAGILAYVMYNSGDLAQILTPTLFPDKPQMIYFFKLSMYVALTGYFSFIRSFLELESLLPNWDKIFKFLTIAALPVGLLDGYLMYYTNFDYDFPDKLTIGFSFIFLMATFLFLYPLFRSKSGIRQFIFTGIILMGIGMLMSLVDRLQTVNFSTIYFKIGAILEIIIFSLGLAYRQQIQERARQKAGFELEKAKLKEVQEREALSRQKEINQLKSALYTNITHEFRTPLTVILGLVKELQGSPETKKLIIRNGENLLVLVNQLLDLAKLETGKLSINWVQADIVSYLKYLIESFLSKALEKSIRLTFHTNDAKILMDYDEGKVQQIIYNLLSNALKFTPDFGTINITVEQNKNQRNPHIVLRVSDNGDGIANVDLPFIFDRFHQGKHHLQGTGIGLALTKELVEMLGGEISVESQINMGTQFIVKLPIHQEALLKEITQDPVEFGGFSEKETLQLTNDSAGMPVILIIEDNKDVLYYIKQILSPNYRVITAKNGKLGIQMAIDHIPDAIICDILMPFKNGYEVCETLKNDTKTSHIPIILLTAKTDFQSKLSGLKKGADAYLEKPFQKEELFVRLDNLIKLRQVLHLHTKEAFRQIEVDGQLSLFPKNIKFNNSIDQEFIQKIIEIIEENLDNPDFGVPQLGPKLYMSQIQVYRKMKALIDISPVQLIRKVRLKKAIILLQKNEFNISEVAYRTGFNDPNYFSRVFQQEFGKPPRDFIKNPTNS